MVSGRTTLAQEVNSVASDRTSAVIFSYQQIGANEYPETSIRLEQFKAHISELENGPYNIMGLPEILKARKEGRALPPRSVAITFDGGYRSVIEHAVPLLLDRDMPFTIFVPTDHLDNGAERFMRWNDIKRLRRNKLVTIGLHPASYQHLLDRDMTEITRQINKGKARYREMTGKAASLFAYPFGEYHEEYQGLMKQQGFSAAFSQHSGVSYQDSELYAIPRFSMTERYGTLERFQLLANALPLPVKDIKPADPYLKTNKPDIGFTINPALESSIDRLSCFVSGQDTPKIVLVGKNRIELQLREAFNDKRTRINCTMPVKPATATDEQRWRWFGMLLTIPVPSLDQRDF